LWMTRDFEATKNGCFFCKRTDGCKVRICKNKILLLYLIIVADGEAYIYGLKIENGRLMETRSS
jgi:hypothetical protein